MKENRKKRIRVIQGSAIICLVLALICFLRNTNSGEEETFIDSDAWYLTIVNEANELPTDYTVDFKELSNGKKIDSRIYPYLRKMFEAARADGVYPIVGEGYRTAEEQKKMMEDKILDFLEADYSQSEAETMAKDWVAKPGTSEHQLGIAVDINADETKCSNEMVYGWLAYHAYKYGFILRYPEGKEEITGISYEPWHYRYVGIEAAREIYEKQICLEEYLSN